MFYSQEEKGVHAIDSPLFSCVTLSPWTGDYRFLSLIPFRIPFVLHTLWRFQVLSPIPSGFQQFLPLFRNVLAVPGKKRRFVLLLYRYPLHDEYKTDFLAFPVSEVV